MNAAVADEPDKPNECHEPLLTLPSATRTEQFAVAFWECGFALVVACSVDGIADFPEGVCDNTRGVMGVVVDFPALASRADQLPDVPAELERIGTGGVLK